MAASAGAAAAGLGHFQRMRPEGVDAVSCINGVNMHVTLKHSGLAASASAAAAGLEYLHDIQYFKDCNLEVWMPHPASLGCTHAWDHEGTQD